MTTDRSTLLYVGDEGTGRITDRLEGALPEADVEVQPTARTAVEYVARSGVEAVDGVVSEQSLPESTGLELLRTVRDRWPDLPFVLCPADGSERLAARAVSADVTEYVPRSGPDDVPESLVDAVEGAVDSEDDGPSGRDDQYERLLEHAPVMYVVTRNRDGTPVVEDCNQQFLDRLGYDREYVVGRRLTELYTEESAAQLQEGGYKRALDGVFTTEKRRLLTADGEPLETRLRAAPRVDEDGDVVGTLTLYFDVTERRRKEEKLQLFRALLDRSNDEVYLIDPESGEYVDVNRTACKRLGYDRDRLLDLSVDQVSTEISGPIDWRSHVETVREEESLLIEGQHRRKDGTRYPVEVNVAHVSLDREYVVAIARDVTDQRRQQRRFKALIENATDLITVVKPDGTVSYQSPSVERLLGYDPEEIEGRNFFGYVHPEDRGELREAATTTGDRPTTVVFRIRDAGGSWRVLEALTHSQLSTPGVRGFVINGRDITERKDRERQLAVIDRILRHNIRNDMDVVVGYAEEIQRLADGDVASLAETVRTRGLDLLETVEKEREIVDVLMEGIDREMVDATTAVESAVETVRDAYPDADVEVDVPDNATVIAASDRIERALLELVENAVIHADRCEPTVEVTVECDEREVAIRVADEGPGIPEDEVGVLTRERDVAPLYHGSGLGLWLVNWIVRRSQGSLSFRHRDDRGSVVTVELPRPDDSRETPDREVSEVEDPMDPPDVGT